MLTSCARYEVPESQILDFSTSESSQRIQTMLQKSTFTEFSIRVCVNWKRFKCQLYTYVISLELVRTLILPYILPAIRRDPSRVYKSFVHRKFIQKFPVASTEMSKVLVVLLSMISGKKLVVRPACISVGDTWTTVEDFGELDLIFVGGERFLQISGIYKWSLGVFFFLMWPATWR